MVKVPIIQPRLSITTTFGDLCSFLCITLSIFLYFLFGRDGGFVSLYTHTFSATVQGDGNRAAAFSIQLSLINVSMPRWEACRMIQVVSERIPPELIVSFWNHSRSGNSKGVRDGVEKTKFCETPGLVNRPCLAAIGIDRA